MNTVSKILLGAVVIAVFACLWFLLTQKNKGSGGCSGNCASCGSRSESCENRKNKSND